MLKYANIPEQWHFDTTCISGIEVAGTATWSRFEDKEATNTMATSTAMDMSSMSGMTTATSTTMDMSSMTGMSMPSATSSTSGGMSGMMGMDSMMMVFFSARNTPLYSSAWMPNGIGQYAGTCIFLIILSVVFRGLMAVRCNFTLLWTRWTRHNETPMLHREADEIYFKHGGRRPWRINESATRAILDTTLAAVSYLL